MPDYPYVDPSPALRPVGPGGTRVRLLRRREREAAPEDERGHRDEAANDAAWEELLGSAVEELNVAFEQAGVPFTCTLGEDEHSMWLTVSRQSSGHEGEPLALDEEVLEPADLPRWLARLRLRLGLLVDETA